MNDPTLVTLAIAGLAGLAMVTAALLTGWRGWLSLQHQQLVRHAASGDVPAASAGARIEIADLKERIRKLEAIAAGVEL